MRRALATATYDPTPGCSSSSSSIPAHAAYIYDSAGRESAAMHIHVQHACISS